MINDEDDYMSDAFMASMTAQAPSLRGVDARHDLPSWKRKAEIEHRSAANLLDQQAHSKKRLKEVEIGLREQGLAQPLTQDNCKGFNMLTKMGFSVGILILKVF